MLVRAVEQKDRTFRFNEREDENSPWRFIKEVMLEGSLKPVAWYKNYSKADLQAINDLEVVDYVAPDPIAETVESVAKDKKQQAQNTFNNTVNALRAGYPDYEVDTWTEQKAEAKEHLADANASTPLLDSLAIERGVDKAVFANLIMQKAALYSSAIGSALGVMQKTQADVDAIVADENLTDEQKKTDIKAL